LPPNSRPGSSPLERLVTVAAVGAGSAVPDFNSNPDGPSLSPSRAGNPLRGLGCGECVDLCAGVCLRNVHTDSLNPVWLHCILPSILSTRIAASFSSACSLYLTPGTGKLARAKQVSPPEPSSDRRTVVP
jgi:hypothetical protein